jgi:hypothetical protein
MFSNSSELMVKSIIEKIILNIFMIIKVKNIDASIGIEFYNHSFKEIKSLLSLNYLYYEKETEYSLILNETIFDNNYFSKETNWDKCDIIQPKSGIYDRWKIHQ